MNKRAWYSIFSILLIIALVSWLAVLTRPTAKLKIIACDVGQGDAMLVVKGTFQMLIDGGPNNKVVSCVSKYIPFWDRELEVVVVTHPDSDHYTGIIEILKRYKVKNFLATEANKDNQGYQELKKLVDLENTNLVLARKNYKLRYGELSFNILSPGSEMFLESTDIDEAKSNSYSIVMHLVYGDFDALLTGDLTPDIANRLVAEGKITDVELLQVPHHGSKNGLTEELLKNAAPELAVISASKDNRYGHPHKEILELLKNYEVMTTFQHGDIVVESDGKHFRVH